MRPNPGEVLHFSEDPTIKRFIPHVAATSAETTPYVWAVDARNAPSYWFPRQCPRAMAWIRDSTTPDDRARLIGAGCGSRAHAIEYGWLDAMRTTTVYTYRFAATAFAPIASPGSDPHAMVATEPVTPLADPEPIGSLLACHEAAGIQLRLLPNLWPFWNEVIASSVGFSGIRLRNAIRHP
ncbi:hypothetical protein GCM10010172_24020 [Paractinoplanes ferrugineus]|uniref:Uncharacterized protein n=1 Tax=Paractinoplanes ferrugineus TaxID=113564 RepID=A0A919MI29_9ACTN|nr:DUF6886 family protein [Actinoplanes ferrugineus]GIE08687.1 hypothetical protein Afe05nite_05270 [Actinoplanes ferrugineus]